MGGGGSRAPIGLEEVTDALHEVRRVGLHRVPEAEVMSLLRLADRAGMPPGAPLPKRLDALLVRAVTALGEGPAVEAARHTLCLAPTSRLLPAQDRRRAAAKALELSPDRFRRAQEKEIVSQVAVELLALPPDTAGSTDTIPAPRAPVDAGGKRAGDSGPPADDHIRVTTLQDEAEYSLGRLLRDARQVAVYGKTWVSLFSLHTGRLRRLVADGGEVRVLLMTAPGPSPVRVYSSEVWDDAHIIARNLQTTHDRLREIATEGGDGFAVREIPVLPQFGFLACSSTPPGAEPVYDRGIVQLNFAYTRVEADRPVLCLPGGSTTLRMFVDEFEAAWDHGEPWTPVPQVSS